MAVVFGSVYGTLTAAVAAAERGERAAGARQVLDAYMAFEAAEGSLAATEPSLVRRAEQEFTSLRFAIEAGQSKWELNDRYMALQATLREAEAAFSRRHSAAGLFMNSLLLMLREGFEAIWSSAPSWPSSSRPAPGTSSAASAGAWWRRWPPACSPPPRSSCCSAPARPSARRSKAA